MGTTVIVVPFPAGQDIILFPALTDCWAHQNSFQWLLSAHF